MRFDHLRGLPAAVVRAPFTALLDAAILVIALTNGSAAGRLDRAIRYEWGFGPLYFWQGHWHSLFTNILLVRNLLMLVGILAFLIVSVGIYERRFGTLRAIVLFFLANVATLLLTAALVVYPLHLAGAPVQWDWAPAGDVGASFGGFGCMGGWIRRLEYRTRTRWLAVATIALAAKILVYPERFGDIGHIIALYAGLGLDRALWGHRR